MAKVTALGCWINGDRVGELRRARGRYEFQYDKAWLRAGHHHPLSLSMPLSNDPHVGPVVENFLWNLLPDNARILDSWARRFEVSASSAIGLLAHVGNDCAGAVRFTDVDADPDQVQAFDVEWLSDEQLHERINDLVQQASDGRRSTDTGMFSLAGAQYKTALFRDESNGRWGVPVGRMPTTHILKPSMPGLADQVWNEHFCLQLARKLKLAAAESTVMRLGDHDVFVTTRYDRSRAGGELRRVHQEDFCQALGVHPEFKYESDGGPGVAACLSVTDQSSNSAADRQRLLAYLCFNVLIGGTDAHAKNLALLWAKGPTLRLAPFYDINSAWPYAPPEGTQMSKKSLRTAMKYGGTRDFDYITAERLARAGTSLMPEAMAALTAKLPDALQEVAEALRAEGSPNQIVETLVRSINKRVSAWR